MWISVGVGVQQFCPLRTIPLSCIGIGIDVCSVWYISSEKQAKKMVYLMVGVCLLGERGMVLY